MRYSLNTYNPINYYATPVLKSSYLGNVITVISDRKTGVDGPVPDNIIDYYLADVRETHDYYPFGYDMPGRKFGTPQIPRNHCKRIYDISIIIVK